MLRFARLRLVVGAALLWMWSGSPALAEVPEIFKEADLKLGERLIKEHRCSECHARKAGGDGAAIYGSSGRLTAAGPLRGMVEYCNTHLSLGLFPEEVTAVAAVINRDHYRFGATPPAAARK